MSGLMSSLLGPNQSEEQGRHETSLSFVQSDISLKA